MSRGVARTEEGRERQRQAGRRIGKIQSRKNVESGWIHSEKLREAQIKSGQMAVESGRLKRISVLGGRVQGRKNIERGGWIHKQGPNKEEVRLYDELERLGVSFNREDDTEVGLGNGMGVADILIGHIVGELDGGGHWANFGRRQGISDKEWRVKVIEKDKKHDRLRKEAGYIVIRETNPIRLAKKIKQEVDGAR